MRERVHVNRTMKDLVADLRLMKSVLLSQYMPFLFAQRQEIGFPSRTEIDGNHSIFRHDNFIGCFSADKIKMSARK